MEPWRQELMAGEVISDLGSWAAVEMTGTHKSREQESAVNHQENLDTISQRAARSERQPRREFGDHGILKDKKDRPVR